MYNQWPNLLRLPPKSLYFEDIPLDVYQSFWFQQNDVPAHYSYNVWIFLDEQYQKYRIKRGKSVLWPSRSPDFNPLDYCILESTKSD